VRSRAPTCRTSTSTRARSPAACPRASASTPIGNPLDLGFTIVEGTYNGLVDKSYDERIHFSGSINPGMSGGPVAAATGASSGVTSPSG
jgi:S1-C subfamily serine protease